MYIYIYSHPLDKEFGGSGGREPASQPASQPAASTRSAEEQQEEQQEEEQQDTNEVRFALVSNNFAHLSRASCRTFPV